MTDRYTPSIELRPGSKACASCGCLWRWRRGNGRLGTRKPDWEGAGLALCRDCLRRIREALAIGREPSDPVERIALYVFGGVTLSRRFSEYAAQLKKPVKSTRSKRNAENSNS